MINYPLKFIPILKDKIWGGKKLKNYLDKNTKSDLCGESWEISDVKDNISVVANGDSTGKNLQELLTMYKDKLVGKHVYKQFKTQFPLLIKFIDANKDLSIQVHPNDEIAKKRHNSFGKNEMWFVMESDKNAELIVGFNKTVSKEEYLHHLNNKTLLDILNIEKVKKGDVYFIPTGRVHAIRAGVMLAEIQQTSDITYRIYDWDRKDAQGNSRELHTKQAVDVIDYQYSNYKTNYKKEVNKVNSVVDCPYFTTNYLFLNKTIAINNIEKDSFVIYMVVSGSIKIKFNAIEEEVVNMGETVLIPAILTALKIEPKKNAEVLEIYIR